MRSAPKKQSQRRQKQLRKQRREAEAKGIDEGAVGDALDGGNPKGALVALLLEHEVYQAVRLIQMVGNERSLRGELLPSQEVLYNFIIFEI